MRKSSIGPLRVRNDLENSAKTRTRVSAGGSRSRLSSGSSRSSLGGGRPSLSGPPAKSQGRQSMIPSSSRRTSTRTYGHEILKDPRPISDKHYKDKSIRELIEFLAEKGYPHPCSMKILHSPSSKEFIRIFEFLYSMLEPSFKCAAKIEEQFPAIMKSLGYPFSISKSAMYAIGSPHMWPTLLAALSWLRMSIDYCMTLQVEAILFPVNDFGVPVSKTVFKYCELTYNAFLGGADTFEEFDEQLAKEIRKNAPGGDLEGLIHEQRRLKQEYEHLSSASDPSIELKDQLSTLRFDKDKINKYAENLESYDLKLSTSLKNLELEEQTLEAELEVLKAEVAKKKAILQIQVFSTTDVQRINMERQMLQQQIDQGTQELDTIQKEMWEDERQIAKSQEGNVKKCEDYNSIAKTLNLIPPTGDNNIDYQLKPRLENIDSNYFLNTIKPALTQLKNQCMDTANDLVQSQIIQQNNLAQLTDNITEKKLEQAQLEKKIQGRTHELEVTKANNQAELQRMQHETEHLEAEIKTLYLNHTTSIPALQSQIDEASQKMKLMRTNHNREKERVCNFVRNVMDHIMTHKASIQEHVAKVAADMRRELEEERQRDASEQQQE